MNLQQLKAFVVLSECLSVTETAERLFCTQPSVSIKIKNLEQSLDTVLFERINNRLFLTE
ncbi:LysR family transcriptional regulator, partial [Glaesserella parasuis]|nr:LysR family transcriptional regulator [Glaesserella parasuis]